MLVLKDRLLVELDPPPSTYGLVLIPQESRDPSYTGRVLAVGPEQLELSVGERVVFSRYAGVPIEEKAGKPAKVVVDSREVLAVVEDNELKELTRTTIAVTGDQLKFWLGADSSKLLYANYSHDSDTLYVTFEEGG